MNYSITTAQGVKIMVTITVNGAQSAFKNGKLELQYFNAYFQFGNYPQQFSGSLQIMPEDGVTILSTETEVKDAALQKLQDMVKERTPDTPEAQPTSGATAS